MRAVDTSAWIEWLLDSPTAEAIAPVLPERSDWVVPTIVQLELAKWIAREVDVQRGTGALAFSRECVVVPLITEIALAAAELCQEHKLATADAIVYATALAHNADLLTCDAHLKDLPHVTYIPKRT